MIQQTNFTIEVRIQLITIDIYREIRPRDYSKTQLSKLGYCPSRDVQSLRAACALTWSNNPDEAVKGNPNAVFLSVRRLEDYQSVNWI